MLVPSDGVPHDIAGVETEASTCPLPVLNDSHTQLDTAEQSAAVPSPNTPTIVYDITRSSSITRLRFVLVVSRDKFLEVTERQTHLSGPEYQSILEYSS